MLCREDFELVKLKCHSTEKLASTAYVCFWKAQIFQWSLDFVGIYIEHCDIWGVCIHMWSDLRWFQSAGPESDIRISASLSSDSVHLSVSSLTLEWNCPTPESWACAPPSSISALHSGSLQFTHVYFLTFVCTSRQENGWESKDKS